MDFVKKSLKDSYEDSLSERNKWMTKEEAGTMVLVQLITLFVVIIVAAILPVVTFSHIMLFLILTECIAIKDTVRRGLTPPK